MTTNANGYSIIEDDTTSYARSGKLWGFYREDTDLDTGESLDTLIVTGDKVVVCNFLLEAYGGQVIAYIDEDTITSDDGTLHPVSNFNRAMQSPTGVRVYSAPTVVDVGKRFVSRRVLAHAQGNSGITSNVTAGVRRYLKPNSKYLLRQTAVSDNIVVTLVGSFYEE
jgi:hypothetical protein